MADQSHLRQSSPLTAIPKVANRPHRTADRMYIPGRRDCLVLLAASVVAINAWALFPSPDHSGHYVRLPETSTSSAADVESAREGVVGSPVNAYRLIAAKLVSSKPTTNGLMTSAAPLTAAYPSLMSALSLVPVKAKLQVLLTLLVSETDPAERADLQAKLQALLKLPEDVLVQVLQHPDLADFNKMLDAVFLGETELWWIEFQLDKINVVPVTKTTDRIDVSGKPAFVFDSTAAAHTDKGGPSTSGLKSLPPTSSEPQVSSTTVSRSVPEADVATFVAPASSDVQVSQFSMSAPVMDVVPSAAPSPGPDPSPAPGAPPVASPAPAPSNAEISRDPIETEPTASPDVFDTGNKFEPETKPSEPVTNNPVATETATPSTPSPGADANPPSDDSNDGGTS
jgi:hypothetical protein